MLYEVITEAALANPALEILRRKGVEVLLLLDPLDEFVMESVHQYGELNTMLGAEGGQANVAVLKSVVTQASSAIPVMPV